MQITEETFEAFLKCNTKSYLKFNGVVGIPSEFSQSQCYLLEEYKRTCRERRCSAVRDGQWHAGTPDLQSLENGRYGLIFDYTVTLPEIHARLDALEQIPTASDGPSCTYIPIRFVPREKVSTYDKLLLAFDAFAFSQVRGKTPHVGRIIHGCQCTPLTVRLTDLLRRVQFLLGRVADQQTKAATPPLVLNKHCAECEFQSRCRQIAIQKDDLSLLPTISEKGRQKQNARGIFTVLQLSYTFRSPRRSARALPKHQPALKALAIRKNQIHILGTPTVSLSGTPVYIDVEGDPDRKFYYLVGLRIGSGGSSEHYSFWANTPADERAMWADCLHRLGVIANPRLVHYGAYETQFLKRMRTRYPDVENPSLLDDLHLVRPESPIHHLRTRVFSDILQRPQRCSQLSGISLVGRRSFWIERARMAISVGILPRSQPEGEAAHLQLRGLRSRRKSRRCNCGRLPPCVVGRIIQAVGSKCGFVEA